jgi:nucleotide-binding universal stress UspA family protein
MTIAATAAPGVARASGARTAPGPIIVGTDGTSSAAQALRAAAQLSAQAGAAVQLIAVLEPAPLLVGDYGALLPPPEVEQARRESLEERVRVQLAEFTPPFSQWSSEVLSGDPASVIAGVASARKASAIVVGLGHHDLMDRLFGGEAALHTLRLANVPVIAVGPSYASLPTRAVAAIDFSPASARAARVALETFDTLSMLYLAHVAPRMEMQPEAFATWVANFGEGLDLAFERAQAELAAPAHVTVEQVTLQGKPARAILEFARSVGADLIVTGSRGAGLIDRILVGSTATGLIRGASCTVLAVPSAADQARPLMLPAAERTTLTEARWAKELEAFTHVNAGRRASLEVDDPDFGAQLQEHGYPFRGASYDHQDGRVQIMLGDLEGTTRHLTRGIVDVHGIDVLRDEQGRDWILQIRHGNGQTILRLAR